jgi:hypothetical protein
VMADIDYSPSPKPLNGKQFSQLSLFNMKPTESHQWPRGYTPERRDEVAQYLPTWNTQANFNYAAPNSPYLGTAALSGTKTQVRQTQSDQATRAITDIVARSTVPAESLTNLPTLRIQGDMTRASGAYQSPSPGSRGYIALSSDTGAKNRADYESTVLHELGHHTDFERNPSDYRSRGAFTRPNGMGGSASPGLEGYAEGFAQGNWRGRRGQEGPSYVSYPAFHNMGNFQQPFAQASGGQTVQQMVQSRAAPISEGQFSSPTSFQPHLFSRRVNESTTQAPGYQDYGQHNLEDWQGQRPARSQPGR